MRQSNDFILYLELLFSLIVYALLPEFMLNESLLVLQG